MKKLLVVIDMQNDFINGALKTPEAQSVVPKVVNKIKNWEGEVWSTKDTHYDNYLQTNEGKYLPIEHCLFNTEGWNFVSPIGEALQNHKSICLCFYKTTFGSLDLATEIQASGFDEIELVGVCTDICVIANALLIKTFCPEARVSVDASCCAGVTPEKHKEALSVMKSCHIEII